MPHASNCDSNISWFRVSKAFDKSRNIPAKYFWQSTALATLFTKYKVDMGLYKVYVGAYMVDVGVYKVNI